eukprot:scaffold2.g7222.t1
MAWLLSCMPRAAEKLLHHPSFVSQGEADHMLAGVLAEEPSRLASEALIYSAVTSFVTPFITSMDEASVSAAALPRAAGAAPVTSRGLVRLHARPAATGFGWCDTRRDFERSMAQEHHMERLVGRGSPAAEIARLQQRLLVARLEVWPLKGSIRGAGASAGAGGEGSSAAGVVPAPSSGGNGLFEALSAAMWGTPLYNGLLRQLAVAYMRGSPEEYAGFLGDDWQHYLQAMARLGTPGDELALRAVADHFGCAVNIVTPDAFMWLLRYAPRRTKTLREVFLGFAGPGSWFPIRRQTAMTTLKLTLGAGSEYKHLRTALRQQAQPPPPAPATPARGPVGAAGAAEAGAPAGAEGGGAQQPATPP